MRRSETLKGVVQTQSFVSDKAGKDIRGEDFGERAKAEERILIGKLMRVRRGLAVALKEDLMIAHDDENHAGGTGVEEELGAESAGGFERGQRCRGRRLRGEGQVRRKS